MKTGTLLLILSMAVVTSSAPARKKTGSPENYHVIGDQLFYIERRGVTEEEVLPNHASTSAFCKSLDMDLPDIVSAQKEEAVLEALGTIVPDYSTGMPFWTSALRGLDGRWMWTNLGQEVTYVNWGSEPSPGKNLAFFLNKVNDTSLMVAVIGTSNLPLVLCQEVPKTEGGFTCKRARRRG